MSNNSFGIDLENIILTDEEFRSIMMNQGRLIEVCPEIQRLITAYLMIERQVLKSGINETSVTKVVKTTGTAPKNNDKKIGRHKKTKASKPNGSNSVKEAKDFLANYDKSSDLGSKINDAKDIDSETLEKIIKNYESGNRMSDLAIGTSATAGVAKSVLESQDWYQKDSSLIDDHGINIMNSIRLRCNKNRGFFAGQTIEYIKANYGISEHSAKRYHSYCN